MCQNIDEFVIHVIIKKNLKIICLTYEALSIINSSDARYHIKKSQISIRISSVNDLDLY